VWAEGEISGGGVQRSSFYRITIIIRLLLSSWYRFLHQDPPIPDKKREFENIEHVAKAKPPLYDQIHSHDRNRTGRAGGILGIKFVTECS
jgi:hypothetical protein